MSQSQQSNEQRVKDLAEANSVRSDATDVNSFLEKLWDAVEGETREQSESRYFDADGKQVTDPVAVEGRVFSYRVEKPGQVEVRAFPSGADALKGAGGEKCVLERTVNGASISLKETYTDKTGKVAASVNTTVQSKGMLAIETSIAGEHRTIKFEDGHFTSLEMEATLADGIEQRVRILLNKRGEAIDVVVTDKQTGKSVDIEPARKARLLGAAKEVLQQVAAQYGLTPATENGAAKAENSAFLSVEDVMAKLKATANPFRLVPKSDVKAQASVGFLPEQTNGPLAEGALPSRFQISSDRTESAEPSSSSTAKLAQEVFGDIMNGAGQYPKERVTDFSQLSEHERVAAMVQECLQYKNEKAFTELRAEAGRAQAHIDGTSSLAATAFHKVCVVRAMEALENALHSGNAQEKRKAITELCKLRQARLGPPEDYQPVHKAIDDYFEKLTGQDKKSVTRNELDGGRVRAEKSAKDGFVQSADAVAKFALAPDDAGRLKAVEQLKASLEGNPDGRLLQQASQLGDFAAALQLQGALKDKNGKDKVPAALDYLEKNSPHLSTILLSELENLLASDEGLKKLLPTDGQPLTSKAFRELLSVHFEKLAPIIQKSMESGVFKKVIEDAENLLNSKLSPADILRVGIVNGSADDIKTELERVKEALADTNLQYRSLERQLLVRGASAEDRARVLKQISELSNSDQIAGDTSVQTAPTELQAVDAMLQIREATSAKDALAAIERLQQMESDGCLTSSRILQMLSKCSGSSAEDVVKQLKGDSGKEALVSLQKVYNPACENELNRLRLNNLTANFTTDKLPDSESLRQLKADLKAEQDHGNNDAKAWLDWSEAVGKVIQLSGEIKEPEQQKIIAELGQMALDGNASARKMLVGIMVAEVEPYDRYKPALSDGSPQPMVRPTLPWLQTTKNEIVLAAISQFEAVLKKHPDSMQRTEAFAVSLALGLNSKSEVAGYRFNDLLKQGVRSQSHADVMSGIFQALNSNCPGGERLAAALLEGNEHEEFRDYFRRAALWAHDGDEAGLAILAAVAAGRCKQDKPIPQTSENLGKLTLAEQAQRSLLSLAERPEMRAPVIEAVQKACKDSLDSRKQISYGDGKSFELLGDLLANCKPDELAPELIASSRKLIRDELDHLIELNQRREGRTQEEQRQYERVVRGYVAMANHFEKEDFDRFVYRSYSEDAWLQALRDKGCRLKPEFIDDFKFAILSNSSGFTLKQFECLGMIGEHITVDDLKHLDSGKRNLKTPESEVAYMRCLLKVIGANADKPEVRMAALKNIEDMKWSDAAFDAELCRALKDYVRGVPCDAKFLDKVMELTGSAGIEPPLALVVSRLGVPLTDELVRDLQQAQENFNGDKDKVFRVIQRAVMLNALASNPVGLMTMQSMGLTGSGKIDLKDLIQRMADGPLSTDSEYSFLTTRAVDEIFDKLEQLAVKQLNDQSRASGGPEFSTDDVVKRVEANMRFRGLSNPSANLDPLAPEPPEEKHAPLWLLFVSAPAYLKQEAPHAEKLVEGFFKEKPKEKERQIAPPIGVDQLTPAQYYQHEQSLENLRKITKDGHQTSNWWLLMPSLYMARRFGPGGNVEQFQKAQASALEEWQKTGEKLGEANTKARSTLAFLEEIQHCRNIGRYANTLKECYAGEADQKALELYAVMGPERLKAMAPFVHDSIVGDPEQKPEIWTRLKRFHVTELERVPELQEARDARLFLEKANFGDSKVPAREFAYSEASMRSKDVVLSEAFRKLDQDERMTACMDKIGKLTGLISTTQMMFYEGTAGSKGPEYVKFAREQSAKIKTALEELQKSKPEILALIKDLRETMDKATDQQVKEALKARIDILNDFCYAYTTVDGVKGVRKPGEWYQSPLVVGPLLASRSDEVQPATNSRRYLELTAMCKHIDSSDFNADDFGKWLDDNAASLVLVTAALAGLALIPFSGGTSGILTMVAVAALMATVAYGVNETYKEVKYKYFGAAYGSDLWRAVGELSGVRQSDQQLRYVDGRFVKPDGIDKVFEKALIDIGRDTAINLIAMGFGQFLSTAFKAATPEATAFIKNAAKAIPTVEEAAATNPLARSWSGRFVKTWAAQAPWAAGGAVGDALIQDAVKDYKDEAGIVEFMGHVASVCITVLCERVGGHIMRPHTTGPRSVEVPYKAEEFVRRLQEQYRQKGQEPPQMVLDGDVLKVKEGKTEFTIKFTDPVKVAEELTRRGVKPDPLLPGEQGRLLAGEQSVIGSGQPRALPKLEPGHLSAAEVSKPLHPESAKGSESVLTYDKATPVVHVEPGAQATYSRGYAIAQKGGGATVIKFTETPQDMMFSGKEKFQQGEHHKPIASDGSVSYFYDTNARAVLKVTKGPEGLTAQKVESVTVTDVAPADMASLKPAVRTEPALKVAIGGQAFEISGAGSRAAVIGPGAKADIRIPDAGGGALFMTDGKAFYVKATAGAKLEIAGADGKRTSIPANETVALRPDSKLFLNGKEITLSATESQRYTVLPTRNMGTGNRGAKPVDMTKTPAVKEIPPGFTYCEELPGSQRVQPRVVDAARDPVLKAFGDEAAQKFAHLKGNDAALMKALTEYVHERMTPRVVDEGYGQPGVKQGKGMNNVAEHVDSAVGGTMMIGDLIARRSGVCLDQAMVLSYLAQKMGLRTEVTTGTWNGQAHAWVTMVDGAGKRIIFDPRNNNLLYNNERGGLPQTSDYVPYGPDNPRKIAGRSLAGEMETDYAAIQPKLNDLNALLDEQVKTNKITAQQHDTFMSSLKGALAKADPMAVDAIGEKVGSLLRATDLPQRLPHLTDILKNPEASKLAPTLDWLVDAKMPVANLKAVADFMKSEAVKNIVATQDVVAMQQFRENFSKLAHSSELPQRLKIASELETGLFKEKEGFRLDFVLNPEISVAKLVEFKSTLEGMNHGDMIFAYPEVVQALRAAGPTAARHLVENLPEISKQFKNAEDAIEKLTAMRMVAEASRTPAGMDELPLIFEQRGVHLESPLLKTFAKKTMIEGLNNILAQPENSYMFTAGSDTVLLNLKGIFDGRGLTTPFNEAIRRRFETLMENGNKIPAVEKEWFAKNKQIFGFDQAIVDKVRAWDPPPPKIKFFPGGENMARVMSEHEAYKSEYNDIKLAGTTNNGNHLIQCKDKSNPPRTNFFIVQKGAKGEAIMTRVIDLDATPIKGDPMFVKHLADLSPEVLKQMGSGLYGDGSVRRAQLDVERPISKVSDGKTETDTLKAYGQSWRVGGRMNRTIMLVTLDAKGQPAIVVVSRCATKAASDVDGSYNNLPNGITPALVDVARPGWKDARK